MGCICTNPDTANHIFGTSEGAGTAILTFLGGFHPQTESLWLTDMAHHHLAIAVVFILAGHQYRTNFGIGHSMREILEAHTTSRKPWSWTQGLFDTVNNSLHFQLGLALASVGVLCSLTAQHTYSLPPYAFLAQDFTTQAALYAHHQYIAGFIMCGAFAQEQSSLFVITILSKMKETCLHVCLSIKKQLFHTLVGYHFSLDSTHLDFTYTMT